MENKPDNNKEIKQGLFDLRKAISNNKGDNNLRMLSSTNTLLAKNISNSLSSISKDISNSNKLLVNQLKKLNSMYIKNQSEDDIFKRADPNLKLINEFEESNKLNKKNSLYLKGILDKIGKSGFFDFLKTLLPFAIGAGGLFGWLITGKDKFLNDMLKDVLKYSPVKFLLDFFEKGLKGVAGGAGKLFGKVGFGKIFKKIYDNIWLHSNLALESFGKTGIGKNVGNFISKALNFKDIISKGLGKAFGKADDIIKPILKITGIGSIFKGIGNIFGKTIGKVGGKVLGKGVGKSLLKKIPVIGAILGTYFGIKRFQEGDWLGGTLEIISGISSIVPGVGTALSTLIDGFLIIRDVKSIFTPKEEKKVEKKKIDWSKVPVIGGMINIIDGMKMWGSNKLEAVKTFSKGILQFVPGANIIFSAIDFFKDKIGSENNLLSGGNKIENFINPQPTAKASRSDSTLKKVISQYGTIIKEASQKTGLPESLIAGIIAQESGGNQFAISTAGAKGPMQLMTGTANDMFKKLGIKNGDVYDPKQNIMAGSTYLKSLFDQYGGDTEKALRAYNWGPGNVNSYLKTGYGAKGQMMPAETSSYASGVLGNERRTAELMSNVANNIAQSKIIKNNTNDKKPTDLSENSIAALAAEIGKQFKKNLPEASGGFSPQLVDVRR